MQMRVVAFTRLKGAPDKVFLQDRELYRNTTPTAAHLRDPGHANASLINPAYRSVVTLKSLEAAINDACLDADYRAQHERSSHHRASLGHSMQPPANQPTNEPNP